MIAVRVLYTAKNTVRQLRDEDTLLFGRYMFDGLITPVRRVITLLFIMELTFWTTRQPYICSESGKMLPSIDIASRLFWKSFPCSKNFWMT